MLRKVFLSSAVLLLIGGCGLVGQTDCSIGFDGNQGDYIDSTHRGDPEGYRGSMHHNKDTTFFAFDNDELFKEGTNQLDFYVDHLNKNQSEKVVIVGHCDERGTREYNIALGERRANSVKSYLVSKGIETNRIKVDSMGKEALRCDTANAIYNVVSGDKDMYHKQNRRAVITLGDNVIDHNSIIQQEHERCETPHNSSLFTNADNNGMIMRSGSSSRQQDLFASSYNDSDNEGNNLDCDDS